jgi:hypothetical protein
MTTENESSGSIQTYNAELPSFLDKKNSLDKTLAALSRELGKHTTTAVEALVTLLTDEKVEPQVKKDAAIALLELQVKVREKVSSDAIARLIAEVKLNPTKRAQLSGEDNDVPLVDFGSVQKVG